METEHLDVSAYLTRIGANPMPPSPEALRQLHRAHMLAVPFENLDIPLGVPIQLNLGHLYRKIVQLGRGGFCYELNALFAWLLEALGYRVRMLEAGVYGQTGLGPPFDHMLLAVSFEDDWLVDVGFGDSFVEPLPFRAGELNRADGHFRLEDHGHEWLYERRVADRWEPQFSFRTGAHQLVDFAEMCRFQQTSPDSVFTRKSVCSPATEQGRVTIANGRLIRSRQGQRQERPIRDQADYRVCLAKHFNIQLDPELDLTPLLANVSDQLLE